MSKRFLPSYRIFPTVLLILQIFTFSQAQSADVRIEVIGQSVTVVGSFADLKEANPHSLDFMRSIAGDQSVADRISGLELFATDGERVEHKQLMPGEYLVEGHFKSWKYKVDLRSGANNGSTAHTSWLANDGGILMLDDLLPITGRTGIKLTLSLPSGWRAITTETAAGKGGFEIHDVQRAVFYVGNRWRERKLAAAGLPIDLAISGEWHFSDDDAAAMIFEVVDEYRRTFGSGAVYPVQVAIAKFADPMPHGMWQAETRGRNVTIISSDMAFKTQSLQRLHEQLRHELFHLWIPNGVNLSGNYDWFYEGFALYQSLKMAVALNRIRFEDFLDTLSRAQAIDARQTQRNSMIELSKNRFSDADTQIYARGMVVAFLCDIAMLDASRGRRSVNDLLRSLFQKHRFPAEAKSGNGAVQAVLLANTELIPIWQTYVARGDRFNWSQPLEAAGLEAGDGATLKVRTKLNGRQKDLLDKLGYNSWRNLSR